MCFLPAYFTKHLQFSAKKVIIYQEYATMLNGMNSAASYHKSRRMAYYSYVTVNKDLAKEIQIFDFADTFIGKFAEIFKNYYIGLSGAGKYAVSTRQGRQA